MATSDLRHFAAHDLPHLPSLEHCPWALANHREGETYLTSTIFMDAAGARKTMDNKLRRVSSSYLHSCPNARPTPEKRGIK